ncbi:MAG: hypothetical protein ACKO6A_05820 [Bacteroidota bacterium]
MKKFIFQHILILNILFSFGVFSQQNVQLCLGADATICAGQTVTITNCNSGSNPTNSAGLYLNSPQSVNLTDDVWSGVANIGFTFNFYGQNYTQCVIGSNGLVSFNTNQANQYCPWSLVGGPIPNMTLVGARNSAMLTYQDINP